MKPQPYEGAYWDELQQLVDQLRATAERPKLPSGMEITGPANMNLLIDGLQGTINVKGETIATLTFIDEAAARFFADIFLDIRLWKVK